MIEPIIYAENTGDYYQIDPECIKVRIEDTFDDYKDRHFWEKGIYYDYELFIYHNEKTNQKALIGSYWDLKGKIFGCADCGMTKLWYVKVFDEDEGVSYEDNIRDAFLDYQVAIPNQICVKFKNELDKQLGIKMYKEEELIKL